MLVKDGIKDQGLWSICFGAFNGQTPIRQKQIEIYT
jgi:hypothetical protein